MIELVKGNVFDPAFNNAYQTIITTRMSNWEDSYNLSKFSRKLKLEIPHIEEARTTLLKKFAFLDDKNEFVPVKKESGEVDPGTYQIKPENMEIFKKEWEEFKKSPMNFEIKKLSIQAITDAKLSGAHLEVLEPMFDLPVDIASKKKDN
jgi:hypothetical protein